MLAVCAVGMFTVGGARELLEFAFELLLSELDVSVVLFEPNGIHQDFDAVLFVELEQPPKATARQTKVQWRIRELGMDVVLVKWVAVAAARERDARTEKLPLNRQM